jgi:uncharacterized membrane protein
MPGPIELGSLWEIQQGWRKALVTYWSYKMSRLGGMAHDPKDRENREGDNELLRRSDVPDQERISRRSAVWMVWLKKGRGAVLFITLIYMTLYLPLMFVLYLPSWYRLNCKWSPVCGRIGYERAYAGFNELNIFFRHQGKLTLSYWTDKEKRHLAEVRDMTDKLLFAGIISAAGLVLTFDRRRTSQFARINAGIIVSLLAVLPFFAPFWRHVFHPLLFNNRLWLNTPYDFSYYLMPRQFFKYTAALLIAVSCLLNLIIWLTTREWGKGNEALRRDSV